MTEPVGSEGLMISGIKAVNVQGIKHIDLTLDTEAGLIPVTGRNGTGKSPLMNAIPWTLGGKRELCDVPVRECKTAGETVLRC